MFPGLSGIGRECNLGGGAAKVEEAVGMMIFAVVVELGTVEATKEIVGGFCEERVPLVRFQ